MFVYVKKVNCKDTTNCNITVNGMDIKPGEHLQVMGVLFSTDLSWNKQVVKVANKAKIVLSKLKFLSRYLSPMDMAKVVTSHLLGLLYYGSQTWPNELTTSSQWEKL